MSGLEYRNLLYLAECPGIAWQDRARVYQIMSARRWGQITDAEVAEISAIRARAARPLRAAYHKFSDPEPPPDAA